MSALYTRCRSGAPPPQACRRPPASRKANRFATARRIPERDRGARSPLGLPGLPRGVIPAGATKEAATFLHRRQGGSSSVLQRRHSGPRQSCGDDRGGFVNSAETTKGAASTLQRRRGGFRQPCRDDDMGRARSAETTRRYPSTLQSRRKGPRQLCRGDEVGSVNLAGTTKGAATTLQRRRGGFRQLS